MLCCFTFTVSPPLSRVALSSVRRTQPLTTCPSVHAGTQYPSDAVKKISSAPPATDLSGGKRQTRPKSSPLSACRAGPFLPHLLPSPLTPPFRPCLCSAGRLRSNPVPDRDVPRHVANYEILPRAESHGARNPRRLLASQVPCGDLPCLTALSLHCNSLLSDYFLYLTPSPFPAPPRADQLPVRERPSEPPISRRARTEAIPHRRGAVHRMQAL